MNTLIAWLLCGPKTDKSEAGATATEYGLLVTFIALLIIAGLTLFGTELSAWYGRLGFKLGGFAT
ncbi:Flp family type IVb pilin [Nocardioides sp. Root140]|uniref:Flp family type IVb pilin n=1 Tax=Nocardioides sp. Root140 TaxID=1736460 RepID=UPI0006F465DF|nr:Flp family type IVb pilin [Nocardioides sp. Root140]KQY64911.1 hypothetical protein ASD30_07485 [Nocardioides sp. Root140]